MSNIGIAAHLAPLWPPGGGAFDAALPRIAAFGFDAVVCPCPTGEDAGILNERLSVLRLSPVAIQRDAGCREIPEILGPVDVLDAGTGSRGSAQAGGRAVAMPGATDFRAEQHPTLPLLALDIGAAKAANRDPAALLRAHPGRCPYVIVNVALAGEGSDTIDWDAIFDAGEEAGVEWYVALPPPEAADPLGWLGRAYQFLAARA